ncbi:MAG: SET domain-containing protein [Candidatus Doudnabacteria bacterium]|nr:SET domain-containing protein [Candidatus Doudnabacteria bacterium]
MAPKKQTKPIVIRPKPSRYQLVAKRSSAGLGLYTLQLIPKGKKIIQYGGYKITNEQADVKGGKYLFEIIESEFTIDGTPRWNLARYANHSCKPNAEAVWYGQDVWICSKRNIQPGEEIAYNYGKDYFVDIIGGEKHCQCPVHKPRKGHLSRLTDKEMKKYLKK